MIRNTSVRNSVRFTAIICLTLSLSACTSNRAGRSYATSVERSAVMTVEAIDVPSRLVTVRTASGDNMTVYVDPSVTTFPQAGVGDRVNVRYVESIAMQLKKPGDAIKGYELTEETARPQPGQPAGAASTEIKTTVKIESVQHSGSKVTFTGPRGRRTATILDPALRDYAKQLRAGDNVEVSYKEAVALSLDKVQR